MYGHNFTIRKYNTSTGGVMDIPYIKGRELDSIAIKLGLKRKKYWWIFKETDKKLRHRCEERVNQITNRQISVLGCGFIGV